MAMWRRTVVTPMSMVIAVEDVESTMVVVDVSEAIGLPLGCAAVIIRSGVAARAWSGGSMQRQYRQH
jgi:hypothetical protein